MITVPSALRKQFAACLHEQAIPRHAQAAYHKWLRYYWDFCHKYHFPQKQQESLPHFLKKLQEKRQTESQREQAAEAIGVYYEVVEGIEPSVLTPHPSQEGNADKMPVLPEQPTPDPSQEGNLAKEQTPPEPPDTNDSGSKQVRTGSGSSWKVEYDVLAETLQSRQYASNR